MNKSPTDLPLPPVAYASPLAPALRPRPTYRITRQVFLRLLGLVYLIAFLSLWVQVDGLIGSHGLLPVRDFFTNVSRAGVGHRYARLPTLLWFNASDAALHWLCGAGVVLSLLVMAGIAQAPALVLLWAGYLSLSIAGQDFLQFQWDILLTETGLLAVFFAPLQMGPRLSRQPEPSPVVRWLLWWLLFRLMFMSGLVKLTYGDTSWLNGSAMNYHYLSQPLPTWTSWYAYKLPAWFQRLSVWSMFAIEVVSPLGIFLGRWPRRVAFAAIVLLQLLIAATGTYGFFNLLTVVLCVPLLDDSVWRRLGRWRPWRRRKSPEPPDPPREPSGSAAGPVDRRAAPVPVQPIPTPGRAYWPLWVTVPVAVVLVFLTTVEAISDMTPGMRSLPWPSAVMIARQWAQPFRSTNTYGLFRVMTRNRPEVVIEGSRDGRTWAAYEFKWKPGDPNRRPTFATPHMPRLDWQIWTPFIDGYGSTDWLINLEDRLLHGRPEVLGLLGHNPFPEGPPKYVRIVAYDYRFTTADERSRTGAWWARYWMGVYGPPLTLDPTTDQLAMPVGDAAPPAGEGIP